MVYRNKEAECAGITQASVQPLHQTPGIHYPFPQQRMPQCTDSLLLTLNYCITLGAGSKGCTESLGRQKRKRHLVVLQQDSRDQAVY